MSHLSQQFIQRQQIKHEEKKKRDRQKRHNERYGNIQQADERTVAARVHAIANQLEDQKERQRRQDEGREIREWVTIAALVVAGTAAFASDVILYCQLLDAHEAATIQHNDTLGALALAKAANDQATDTAKRQLRAYVGIFTSPKGPDGGILVANVRPIPIDIRNLGHTPAYGAENRGGADILPYPLPKGVKFGDDPADTNRHPTTIYPSAEPLPIFVRTRRTFTPEDLNLNPAVGLACEVESPAPFWHEPISSGFSCSPAG